MGSTNSGKSLWMQNIAANVANMGYNVVYFTLEMSEAKVLKRLGAMRLNIPINDYDEKSKNTEYIKEKIKQLKEGAHRHGDAIGILSDQQYGAINVKFFAAGTATINHLENHLKNLQLKKGFKPDLIIVDYITLMAPLKGLGVEGNLYMKGKHLAESLRSMAAHWEVPLVTAIQVAKDAWNASDVTLDKIPESKAIAETADVFAAIIRTEEMKRNNKYVLKLLKQRDGDFSRSKAKFDLNPKFLTIENDTLVDDEI
jgi:replicative DNA helicase